MRRIREILRLRLELGDNQSAISLASGVSRSTVRRYLERAAMAQLDMTTALTQSDAALEAALFPLAHWRPTSCPARSHLKTVCGVIPRAVATPCTE